MISDGNVYETIKVVWCDIKMTSYPHGFYMLICHITVVLSKHIGFISVFLPTSTIFHGKCWSMLVHVTVLKPSQTMWPGNMSEKLLWNCDLPGIVWKQSSEQWLPKTHRKPRVVLVVENGIPVRLLMIPITKLVRFAITKLIKQGWLRQPRNWDSQQLESAFPSRNFCLA